MIQLLALATLFLLAGGSETHGQVPDILIRAHYNRENFKTAKLRYEEALEFPGVATKSFTRYQAQISGDDIAWTDFGDADGVVEHDPVSGAPLLGMAHACAYQQTIRIRATGLQWYRAEGLGCPEVSKIRPLRPILTDPRSIGLITLNPRDTSPSELLNHLMETPSQWRVTTEGDLKIVTMRSPPVVDRDAQYEEVVWKIDPSKDDAVVSVEHSQVDPKSGRKQLSWAKTTYQLADGRWWPKTYESGAPQTGGKVHIVFGTPEFNRPDHPTELTPDIWHLPTGVNVASVVDEQGNPQAPTWVRYMGEGLTLPDEEWQHMDTDSYYPTLKRYWAKQSRIGWSAMPKWWDSGEADFGLDHVAYRPDAWEAYVRRWILKHSDVRVTEAGPTDSKLSEQQVASAWSILKDCRERAEPICRRMVAESKQHKRTSGSKALPMHLPAVKGKGAEAKLVGATSDGVKRAATQGTPTTQPSPADEFPEPAWSRDVALECASHTEISPDAMSPQQRELARIFKTLQRRLTRLLEREQKLSDDQAERRPNAATTKPTG